MAWTRIGHTRWVLMGAPLVFLAAAAVGLVLGQKPAAAVGHTVLVYRTSAPQVTVGRVEQLAKAFGLSGRPVVSTSDALWVVGSGRQLQLYRASGAIRYIDRDRFDNPGRTSQLPSPADALQIANGFLHRYGLLPSAGVSWSSSVAHGVAADNLVAVTFSPSLGGVPIKDGQVVVWLGAGGMVVRLRSDFRPIVGRPRAVPLRPPAAVWADVVGQLGTRSGLSLRLAYDIYDPDLVEPYLDPFYEAVDSHGRAFTLVSATTFTPRLSFDGPDPTATIDGTNPVTLKASAVDGRPPYRFTWASDVDGRLGTGPALQVQLSSGQHQIELTVRDANGSTTTGVVPLYVVGGRLPAATPLSSSWRTAVRPRTTLPRPRGVSSGELVQADGGISFRVLRDHTHPLILDSVTMNGVKRVERLYFDQYSYKIGVKNTNDPTNTVYHLGSPKCTPLSDAGQACPGMDKFAKSDGALGLRLDAAGALRTSEYIANLPGELRLRWFYRTDSMYCAQKEWYINVGTKLITLGNSRYIGGSCPGVRPEIDWTYEPPSGLLSDSQVADFCTQPGAVCDIPPDYYSGGSTAATWEFVDFEAKLFTAVVPPGRLEDSALVQDSSSECRLAKTNGPIDRRNQPPLLTRAPIAGCPLYLKGNDLLVEITPIRFELSALMARRSGRGDWDNFHLKSGSFPVRPVAYPGCNHQLIKRDTDPCIHFHENWLSETPGPNQTYSRGQTVNMLIAVFHAGEASPNDPTSIVNNELLFGRHIVAWHESDAFSDQCGSPGGIDNASRPCQVFTNGLFFTPRD